MTGPSRVGAIHAEQVTKTFTAASGSRYTAIRGVTLDISEGVFMSVVGPSGCGKSTLLNLVAGLTSPTSGTIEIYVKAVYTRNLTALTPAAGIRSLAISDNGALLSYVQADNTLWYRRVVAQLILPAVSA